ncbi:MAG: ABC transporter ATP-binding protein [Lachnospiraceae bacterium]|nr:ABC transporter ATP-binding protein [Lachnospiraceae bacterium]
MSQYVIEANQVSKSYGSVLALDRVSLCVKEGSIYGLIGDNGAGKSTFLKLLAGHVFCTNGEIRLFDKFEEKEIRLSRRQTGFMIEQPGLFPGMTAEKVLEYYRIQKGVPGKGKTEEMLKLTGIWEKRKCKCKKLSMGQKQRLGLAIAMIGEPRLLVLDEPINGLDPSGILEFRTLLHRLNEEKGITILLSSHILSELQQTAHVFGFLSKGKLLEEISADKLAEKCMDYLDIKVTDVEEFAALLEKNFPEESFRVLPDRTIQISHPSREPESYSRLAADNGLYLKGLERKQASLEDYYISLKNSVK